MSIYKDYFNSIKFEKDIGQLSEIITKAERKQIPVFRRFSVVFAAVFMALGVSVTAYAAVNNWDFDAILNSWFGGNAILLEDSLAEVTIENMIDNMENVDISITGAVCDNGITTIFLDIERTDGKIFDTNPIPRYDFYGNPVLDENNEQIYDSPRYEVNGIIEVYDIRRKNRMQSRIYAYIVKDEAPSDNKLTLAAVPYGVDDGFNYINDDNRAEVTVLIRDITRTCLEPYNEMGYYRYGVSEHLNDKWYNINSQWYAKASFDYTNVNSKTINAEGEVVMPFHNDTSRITELKACEGIAELNKITVTNISLILELEFIRTKEQYYPIVNREEGIAKLYMKDGSYYTVGNDDSLPSFYNSFNVLTSSELSKDIGKRVGLNARHMLPEPIDLNQVDYIEISGKTYKF